jgi:hypothetical protein
MMRSAVILVGMALLVLVVAPDLSSALRTVSP